MTGLVYLNPMHVIDFARRHWHFFYLIFSLQLMHDLIFAHHLIRLIPSITQPIVQPYFHGLTREPRAIYRFVDLQVLVFALICLYKIQNLHLHLFVRFA